MKNMPYVKVGAAACMAVCASFWVLRLSVGNFLMLLIGSVCFFGVYGGVLLILGEPMTREILQMLIQRIRNVNR